MKTFWLLIILAIPIAAQQFTNNDPYINSTIVVNSFSFVVDRFYPFVSQSEKPATNELGIQLTDKDGKYTAYLYFRNQYTSPTFDSKKNIVRLYFSESFYQIILKKLEDNNTLTINYRVYKDGHSWGDINFDKYPL
jgi:hypothetical protein